MRTVQTLATPVLSTARTSARDQSLLTDTLKEAELDRPPILTSTPCGRPTSGATGMASKRLKSLLSSLTSAFHTTTWKITNKDEQLVFSNNSTRMITPHSRVHGLPQLDQPVTSLASQPFRELLHGTNHGNLVPTILTLEYSLVIAKLMVPSSSASLARSTSRSSGTEVLSRLQRKTTLQLSMPLTPLLLPPAPNPW